MNIVVAQSGGPTCAINASLLGVYRGALKSGKIDKVYGSLYGIEGMINDNLVLLNDYILDSEDMELVRQTPSTLLCSCRHKLKDYKDDPTEYEKILSTLKAHDIGAVFYIGGNDSMDTTHKISGYFNEQGVDIRVMGIPKTIDNDLCVTDHTPGFGSAAKYVATTLQEIARDCTVYDLKSVLIVEIMGRDTGWLTASSALLRSKGLDAPHLVYLPEVSFSLKEFLEDVTHEFEKRNTVIVAVSEGIELAAEDIDPEYRNETVDNFGHRYLSGVGKQLENAIRSKLGCKVRSIELNTMQRCASHVSSKTDIDEAEQVAIAAVDAALAGETGRVMAIIRVKDKPYTVSYVSVAANEIANKVKYVPREWINERGNNVTNDVLDYMLPLIQGEQDIRYKDGLPVHFTLDK